MKKYKHTITEDLFLEALIANESDFAKKRDFFHKNGIVRTNGSELLKEMPFLFEYGISNERVTFIYNAEIKRNPNKASLILSHINDPEISSLLLFNCYSDSIFIDNCTLAKREHQQILGFNIYLIETTIEKLLITDSVLGNLNSREFITNDLAINKSHFWDFRIHQSIINTFAFNESSAWQVRINYESDIGRISIKQTKLSGLYIKKSKIIDLRIFLKSKLESLHIYTSQVDEFSICNLSSSKRINIGLNSTVENIYISDNIDITSLSIDSSTIKQLNLKRNVNIYSIALINSIVTFIKCENLSCNFLFNNIEGNEVKVLNSNSNKLVIKDCSTDFYIENGKINFLNLSKSSLPQANIVSLCNMKIFSVLIDQLSVIGKLFFIKVSALQSPFIADNQKLNINKEIEEFSFRTSTLRIAYSSLGESEIIDSDLSSFDSFEFSNSRITNTFLTSGSMPIDNIRIYQSNSKSEEWYDQMVSLHNQFSSIFKSQGHIYQSVNYRAKSAEYQHELLKSRKHIDHNWFDRFPFFWNKLSSEYGTKWAKAIWFIIWTSASLYLLILISTGNLFQFHMAFEPMFFDHYFDFINPLRPFDFYARIEISSNWVTKILDLLSRVVIGYGVYQLITAFRKYGKK